ncbi:alpha/beta hydrolase [Brevibacterium sp. UMB10442]|nr:alpha/beta hydrolase [Brevibacterium sp. UMB10442]
MDFIDSVATTFDIPVEAGTLTTSAWLYPPSYVETTSATSSHRPILFIHGFRGDHHGMALIAHNLRTHEALVPDLPGFGQTPPLPTTTLDSYTKFIDELYAQATDHFGTEPVLAGHSFGSILAAHWAANNPTIPGLVLMNPITISPRDSAGKIATRITELYYHLGRDLPTHLGRSLLSNWLIVRGMSMAMATTDDPGLRRYIHEQHHRHFSTFSDPKTLSEAFDVSMIANVAEVSGRLTMPVLVIAGKRDFIVPIQSTNRFIDSLPNARARVFDGVGHLVHYEAAEATAREIEDFAHDLSDTQDSQDPAHYTQLERT